MNSRIAVVIALVISFLVATCSAHVDAEVAKQLNELREQNELMRAELAKYREAIQTAGGERRAVEQESFMEVEEDSEDPSIQCQTICKFVRPNVGKAAEAEAVAEAEEAQSK